MYILEGTFMQHLNITFPENLKMALDREAKKEHTKRSTLIQKAVRVYLDTKKHKGLIEFMKKGYAESAGLDREINKEWDSALSDGLDD